MRKLLRRAAWSAAVRLGLDVRRFTDYRPESSEVLLLCEKTDELAEATGLAPVVIAHRRETP